MTTRMHDDELTIDADLVRRLLAEQVPSLTGLPIRRVASAGTVNALFRIGDHHVARLPLSPRWSDEVVQELQWLPRLAPHLTLDVPTPIADGRPTDAFPHRWCVHSWLDGDPYDDALIDDERNAARDLARFVRELRVLDPTGAGPAGRRPLRELDGSTRDSLAAAHDLLDADAALAAWDRALAAPAWDGERVWIHADLLRPNLLVRDGRLAAVIDWGAAGAGDPATDVIAAWSVFGPTGRAAFREALDVDDGTWERARGIALHQAAGIVSYYRVTNPPFARLALRTIEQVVTDRT